MTICYFVTFVIGQTQGNMWFFGNQAGLDFNTSPPTSLFGGQTDFPNPNQWNEGSSSISNNSGSLLFYTDGMKIWNRQHQVMPNGNNIMGHSSSTQSSIIVPKPNSSQYFYVFTTDASENNFQNGLRYSVVDICLDNGFGDVTTEKNVKIIDTVSEKLICIKHTNETDYWIITHKLNSDAFYSFRLTQSGIIDTIISNTGTLDPQGWGGQMAASPNGQKIAYAIPNGQSFGKTLLLNFDASTGMVSNEQILSTGGREWGTSFSPDNSKLYFSTVGIGEVFQYDLSAGNLAAIISSKKYIVQNGTDSWRHHQLGPDGKIYIARPNKLYLSVIDNPNSSCPSCNYIDNGLSLGGQFSSFGLPNFIAGYNYSNEEKSCTNSFTDLTNSNSVLIFPNPFSSQTTLMTTIPLHNASLTVENCFGQIVTKIENINQQNIIFNRDNLANGVYLFRLKQDDKVVIVDKLIITD